MGTSIRVSQNLPQAGRASGLVSAALLIAGVTVLARIIGFLRFAILARTVGTTCLGDVYASANAVPNVIYELVIGGALAAVVVPLVAGRVAAGDTADVRQTVAALHGWVLTLLVPVTVVGYLLSGFLVDLFMGTGCDTPKASDTALAMLWVFLIQLPIYGLTVVAQGALQAHRRFLAPALAPAISSLVVIAGYLTYALLAGSHRGSLEDLSTPEFIALAGGTTLGVFALLAVQLPALARAGLVSWPSWRLIADDGSRLWPLAWGGSVVVAGQWLAFGAGIVWSNTYGDAGSALIFTLGWTLFMLPWAVLVLPIATSVFPQLARLHTLGEHLELERTIALSSRAALTAAAVGGAGLAAVANPLSRVMIAGAPGTNGVPALRALLLGLAAGVVAYGVQGHAVRVLAAMHRAPFAALGASVGWAVGLLLAAWRVREAHGDAVDVASALGWSFSLGLVIAAIWLLVTVHRIAGQGATHGLAGTAAAALTSAAIAGWGIDQLLGDVQTGIWASLGLVLLGGLASTVVVLGAVALTDRAVVNTLVGRWRRGAAA